MFVFIGKFDEISPGFEADELAWEQMRTIINGLVKKTTKGFDPKVVEGTLKGLRVPTNIADATAHMLHYVNEFFQRLEDVGYVQFKSENPKKNVELLCRYLLPYQLRTSMEERVEYDTALERTSSRL